jgi:hypothetical protein
LACKDGIYVHDVAKRSEVLPVSSIVKAKGATLFAIDSSQRETQIVVALKKKLVLFEMSKDATEFVEIRVCGRPRIGDCAITHRVARSQELALPDAPRILHFCGENVLCGYKKEYAMVRLRNGAVTDVCQAGKTAPPIATPLPEQQILLMRDNIGVFTYFDGRATGRAVVTFTEPPNAIAYVAPYVVAATLRGIEVRGIGAANGLAQLLPGARGVALFGVGDDVPVRSDGTRAARAHAPEHDDASAAAGADDDESEGALLFAASPERLWRLRSMPLGEQCERLVRERRFDEALALCDAMPADSRARGDRLRSIKRLYAQHLFTTGVAFDRALGLMFDLHVNAFDVLGELLGVCIASGADAQ